MLGWERTGRHDSRHGAAKTDEHGHEAAARQAKATQYLIHDKGNACHVARVFQNGEEQKEHDDNRQEGQHAAHTRKHAVDSQRAHHVVGAERLETRIGRGDDGSDAVLHESLQRRADHAKRQPKDEAHDHQERRNGRVATRQDAVNLNGAHVLAALVRLDDATPAHVADKAKAHIGQRGQAVGAGFALHLGNDVLDSVELIAIQVKRLGHQLIALNQLGRCKAHRDVRRHGMVLDKVGNAVDAAMQCTTVRAIGRAEVQATGALAEPRHVQGMIHQLADTLVAGSANGDNRHAQQALEQVDVHGAAVGRHLVHHVERNDHGAIELHKLQRQVQIALDVGGVDDVDDGVGGFVQDESTADDLFARVRRQRIDARQVGNARLGMVTDSTVLAVDRHAGKVTDVLVGARQLVEQRGLTAVLVAGEGKMQRRALGHGRLCRAGRIRSLAERRVLRRADCGVSARTRVCVVNTHELDASGIVLAQRQLVATQTDLERVAHGGVLHHGDFGARR